MAIIKWWVERKKWVWNIYTSDSLVLDEVIPDNLPWINSTKINSDIEIEWSSSWSTSWWIAETTLNNLWPTFWTETEFTWFGFTPKKVIIQWASTVWLWYFNKDWVKRDQTTTKTSESWHLIYIDNWGNILKWFLKEFTSDWFIITWDSPPADFFFFYATCFSEV